MKMRLKKLGMITLGCIGVAVAAHANEVLLVANQPTQITFRIAHQNQSGKPVFGELQSVNVNKNVTVPIELNNYDLAGLVIVSANGHELPPSFNQFGHPEQCSMATDRTKTKGALKFTLSEHSISCSTYGGIFG